MKCGLQWLIPSAQPGLLPVSEKIIPSLKLANKQQHYFHCHRQRFASKQTLLNVCKNWGFARSVILLVCPVLLFAGVLVSSLSKRLDQALGHEEEVIQPVQPVEPYQERLPCLEPIVTATGIEIALQRLLETLCHRLQKKRAFVWLL